MKKSILSIVLVVVLIACVACSTEKANNLEKETNIDALYEDEDNNNTDIDSTRSEDVDNPELALEALNRAEVSVLSSTVVDYEDAYINGYLVHSDVHDKGTIITIGIKFAEKNDYDYFKDIRIIDENPNAVEGLNPVQTRYNSGWISDNNDYMLIILRVGGEVDTTKAKIKLLGDFDTEIEKPFDNSGKPVGFDEATKLLLNRDNRELILKLKNRHYIQVRLYESSSGWGYSDNKNEVSSSEQSYVLIPLEGGLTKTLTNEDVKLYATTNVPNTTGEISVNEKKFVDASNLDCQTIITLIAMREVVEPENDNEDYADEVYDAIDKDIDTFLRESYVEIDDGDGNIVKLPFKY